MRINYKKMTELIKRTVQEIDPTAQIYLYGSRARKTARRDSDWDILILLKQDTVTIKDEQSFRHKLVNIELETGQTLSTFVYSIKDWITKYTVTPLYQNIQKEGILL